MSLNIDAIVPILQPPDWVGAERCLCRRLLDESQAHALWVALGEEKETARALLMKELAAELEVTYEDAHERALRNLKERPNRVGWEANEFDGVKFLLREGDELTASDIVDNDFLDEAAKMLDSDFLHVAIPTRTTMAVTGLDGMLHVIPLARKLWESAEEDDREPLTPLVYCYAEGQLVGLAVTDDEEADEDEDGDAEAEEAGFRPTPMQVEKDGKPALLLCMTCNSFDELAQAIQREFRSYAPGLTEMEGFGGEIHFDINPNGVEPSDENKKHLTDLMGFLTRQAAEFELKTADGDPIFATFEFGPPGF